MANKKAKEEMINRERKKRNKREERVIVKNINYTERGSQPQKVNLPNP